MTQGLGLGDFLTFDDGMGGGGRSRGDWLKFWTKKPGEIVVWLHPSAKIYAVWRTQFPTYGTYKKDDKQVEVLRGWESYVGWDAPAVYAKQNWYDDDNRREVAPERCPFQRMKEWLRGASHLPIDAAVFRWKNPETGEVIEWTRGHASGLVKRGQSTFGHKLDASLEYLFTVVDDAHPDQGPLLTWEKKSLGDTMRDVMTKRIDSLGADDGNVMKHPAAWKWTYNAAAKTASDYYDAYILEKVQLSREVRDAFDIEPPDCSSYVSPRDGDDAKIRAAFEVAVADGDCTGKIPIDHICSDEPLKVGSPPPKERASASSAGGRPRSTSYGDASRAKESAPTGGAPSGGRRRRVEEPPPKNLEPCEACGFEFPDDAPQCPKCGQKYDVDPPKETTTKAAQKKDDRPASKGKAECWACKHPVDDPQSGVCPNCAIDLGDKVPF